MTLSPDVFDNASIGDSLGFQNASSITDLLNVFPSVGKTEGSKTGSDAGSDTTNKESIKTEKVTTTNEKVIEKVASKPTVADKSASLDEMRVAEMDRLLHALLEKVTTALT